MTTRQRLNPFAGLRRNHYAVILADPPWRFQVYSETTGSRRAASNHYAVMDLADICGLPVANHLAAHDAVLFLWTTAPFLEMAFTVIAAWDFKYSTNLVWTKDKLGTGYWCRSQHEHLLISRRGNFRAPKPADRPSSVIQAPRREHSRKPDEVYSIIERAYPKLAKVELFARHARSGWTAWGDEAPGTTQNKQNGITTPSPAMEAVMKPIKHAPETFDLEAGAPTRSIDSRLAFFARAAARLHLIEAGYVDLDTAFADLVPAFRQIAVPPCQCERKILASLNRHHRKQRQERFRAWRRS